MPGPPIELRVLGPPELVHGDRTVEVHSNKVLGLLAYLALSPLDQHPRTSLAELLWEGADDPRHSLRQALYSARRSLGEFGPEIIQGDRNWVRFQDGSGLRVDASEFLELSGPGPGDLERAERAIALCRGPLLQGLDFGGQRAFDHWLRNERARLARRQRQALSGLAEGHLRLHHLDSARRFAERLTRLDPLDGQANRILMRIHAARGDRTALEEQYRQHRQLLREELDEDVPRQTRSLYRQLARKPEAADRIELVDAAHDPEGDWLSTVSMEGREQVLDGLEDALEGARGGRTRFVLIEGEAGIGKSRLLREFIDTSASLEPPARALHARAPEHELTAPYTLWAEALEPLTTARWSALWGGVPLVWREQISDLLLPGDRSPQRSGLSADGSRLRLHQALARAIEQLADRTTLILALDDLQWIDEASLALLSYLIRHVERARLLIVGAHRPEASPANAAWSRFLSAPERHITRIQLGPLEVEDVRSLLARLPAAFEESVPRVLHSHSDGNPLVLLETLRALRESGHLAPGSTQYRLDLAGAKPPVPARIQDLVRHRLSDLSHDARRALTAAAVIGRPFSVRSLHQVTGLAEPFLLDVCRDLERRGLFEGQQAALSGRSLDLSHGYLRRAVYDDLSPSQRQALHLRVAETLHGRGPRSHPHLEEVAFHFQQAGDRRAPQVLVRAAEAAIEVFAYPHAARLCRSALNFAQRTEGVDPGLTFDALAAWETALDRLGRRSEQTEVIDQMLTLAAQVNDDRSTAAALLRQASLRTHLGDHGRARSTGQRAVELLERVGDDQARARALRELAFNHWGAGDFRTALGFSRQVLQIHRDTNDVSGQASALHNLAEIHRELGSPRRALDLYRQSIDLHWSTHDLKGEGLALYGSGHAQRQRENREAAQNAYRRALSALQRAGDKLMVSRVHHTLASLALEHDDLEAGLSEARRAIEISREIGYGPGIGYGLTLLAQIQLRHDDRRAAIDALSESLDWLRLMEDVAGAAQAAELLERLSSGHPTPAPDWPRPGWFRSHVPLEEGKVYCAFESPLARSAAG